MRIKYLIQRFFFHQIYKHPKRHVWCIEWFISVRRHSYVHPNHFLNINNKHMNNYVNLGHDMAAKLIRCHAELLYSHRAKYLFYFIKPVKSEVTITLTYYKQTLKSRWLLKQNLLLSFGRGQVKSSLILFIKL